MAIFDPIIRDWHRIGLAQILRVPAFPAVPRPIELRPHYASPGSVRIAGWWTATISGLGVVLLQEYQVPVSGLLCTRYNAGAEHGYLDESEVTRVEPETETEHDTGPITRQALVAARRPIRLTPYVDERGTAVPGWWTAQLGGTEIRLRESRRARRLEPSRRVWIAADDSTVLEERDVYFGSVAPVPPPDLSYTPRPPGVFDHDALRALTFEIETAWHAHDGAPIDDALVRSLQARLNTWSLRMARRPPREGR